MSDVLSPQLLAAIREAIANGQIPEIAGIATQVASDAVSAVTSVGVATLNTYTNNTLGTININVPAITPEPSVDQDFYTQ